MDIKRTALTVLLFLLSQQASMAVAALIDSAQNDVQAIAIMAPNTVPAEAVKTAQISKSPAVQSHDQHCDGDASAAMKMEQPSSHATTSADCCSFDCNCCVGSCQSVLAALNLPLTFTVSHQGYFFYAVASPRTSTYNLLRPPITA
ncbi:MAG: hypothetical protein ACI89D_002142 [Bermanella sp.]|jgi:hypothetical protein